MPTRRRSTSPRTHPNLIGSDAKPEYPPGSEFDETPVTLPPGVKFDYVTPEPLPENVAGSLAQIGQAYGIEVVIRRKHGMGQGSHDEEVDWPAGWPLPKVGESVSVNGVSGQVIDIRFDLDKNRIVVACK